MTATLKAETLRALAEAVPAPVGEQIDAKSFARYVKAEGALAKYLRNAVPEILALLEADKDERVAALEAENGRMREALERCAECDPESAMFAAAALGKDQAYG